jgi:hypothetical protein
MTTLTPSPEETPLLKTNGPLRNPRHELFARARALLVSPQQAAREAGYPDMTASNAARLDRRKDIQARVAQLSALDDELVRWKRARIEARLELAAFGNILHFAIVDEETGELTGIDWRKVKDSDLAVTVSEFGFDAKSGNLMRFGRDNALGALSQLRDMLGFKAPSKVAMTDPTGTQSPTINLKGYYPNAAQNDPERGA